MSEWQPIETAPKDGTSILISDGQDVGIAKWEWLSSDGILGLWRYQAGSFGAPSNYDDDPYPVCDNPTDWMPLPAPPPEIGRTGNRNAPNSSQNAPNARG